MNMILKWVLFALLIMFIAWVIPGITITGFLSALFVVLILGLVNTFIKPLVNLVSLPLNVFTLGIFSLIINALLFLLVAKFSPGFKIDGFWSGFFGALILSVSTPLIDKINIGKKV
ncbi:MAG: phage holin family protein [Candidatus Gastranaerophilales bacterium]|nr:phage holin family protein [Candidatus Gastranaerophilales bacterium]